MRPVLNRIAALTLLFGGLLMTGCCGPMLACRSGCGEVYIDPWINEPVDPCDCGNYNGLHCGRCRPLSAGIKTVWGYKYDGGCDSCSGCPSCGGGCDSCGGHEPNCGAEMVFPPEISCGVEPTCGFETGAGSCSGCASCSGGGHPTFVDSGIPLGASIVETDPHASARVVIPGGTRVYRESSPRPQPQPMRDRPTNSRL